MPETVDISLQTKFVQRHAKWNAPSMPNGEMVKTPGG